MPHGGVAASAAVGGDCPSGGISVCKSVCARVCVSVCVRKGVWGRQSSPEVWGSERCTPFSLSDTPSSLLGIPQSVSHCPMRLGAGRCH